MATSDRVTISEIAESLGVHKSTVSLALRDDNRLSLATRERVQRAAKELGYEPDPHISNLMGYLRGLSSEKGSKFATIAYLTVARSKEEDRHHIPFYSKFRNGAQLECRRLGYKMEEFKTYDYDLNLRRLGSVLVNRGIKGVIVSSPVKMSSLEGFPAENFASVTLGYGLLKPNIHRVISDQGMAIKMALDFIADSGYKRVVLAYREEGDQSSGRRWSVSFLGNQRLHQSIEDYSIYTGQPDGRFVDFFMKRKADSLICLGHDYGLKLVEAGVRLPEDFGCIPLDSDSCPLYFHAIDQQPRQLGILAAREITGMLLRNEIGVPEVPICHQILPKWQVGTTCPPVRVADSPSQ